MVTVWKEGNIVHQRESLYLCSEHVRKIHGDEIVISGELVSTPAKEYVNNLNKLGLPGVFSFKDRILRWKGPDQGRNRLYFILCLARYPFNRAKVVRKFNIACKYVSCKEALMLAHYNAPFDRNVFPGRFNRRVTDFEFSKIDNRRLGLQDQFTTEFVYPPTQNLDLWTKLENI